MATKTAKKTRGKPRKFKGPSVVIGLRVPLENKDELKEKFQSIVRRYEAA